jgi:ribosomal protein L32E
MNKIAFITSISKQYLSIQQSLRRHKKTMSTLKLIIVSFVFIFAIGYYAKEINELSTKGYFLKQEMKELEQLAFKEHIVELDVLLLERKLWDTVSQESARRYESDRVVVLYANQQVKTEK